MEQQIPRMILVTGASGKTGRALVNALSKVESICAFIHREEHVSVMKSLGVGKVIVGDMHDESAIHSAMQGARSVYHICPNMNPNELGIGKLVIAAARESDVEHFVYHSVMHPQAEKMSHHWGKLHVEETLFESGLPFTILQPAPYMQNLLAGWKSIIEEGVLRVPYSVNSKFSFVDLEDVAEVAKMVLTQPNHTNVIYELVGTQPLSHVEVAEILSSVLNHEVRAEKEEISDWRRRASTALATNARSTHYSPDVFREREEYTIENLVKMFEYYNQWGLTGNPNVLGWLLQREPTSLKAFVERAIKKNNALH